MQAVVNFFGWATLISGGVIVLWFLIFTAVDKTSFGKHLTEVYVGYLKSKRKKGGE